MRTIVLFVFFVLQCSSSLIVAQNKSQERITGKVTDATTGEAIPGVNILVEGTFTGTITGVDGRYSVMVSGPESVLVFSFIGYASEKVTMNKQRTFDVVLKPDVQALGEVVITAQGKGQKQALQQQINSNTIKNVVAPDRLQENPDANATEAIGRLPGISVLRSGGEGTGLVIRGLEPRYASVSLNGMQLPSTNGSDRGTNISGISQYVLQGVEVIKSLTADMEANSVAGTVNLKLREAPRSFHLNLMVQGGYNHLNSYWGNYKLLGEISNRFFNDKLGILLTANAERVNRSIQTMSATYGIDGDKPDGDIMLSAVSLNNISSIIYRRSAMLSLDYKLSPGTTLMFYSMYTNSQNDYQRQSKNYGLSGAGFVGYSFASNPNDKNDILQSSLSGESKFNILNIKADYGISYSQGNTNNKGDRTWDFVFNNASSSNITTPEHRKMDPTKVVPLFTDDPSNFLECWLNTFGFSTRKMHDKNINAYLNLSVPYKLGEQISGNIKFGGMYRVKSRFRDDLLGTAPAASGANQYLPRQIADSLNWIVRNSGDNISAIGLGDQKVDNFLNGDYNFGYNFNMGRLNQITNTWDDISNYYYALGPSVYLPMKSGYQRNTLESMINNQNIRETYAAGYVMPEINFGKLVMFMPGVRFENTHATMEGFYAMPPTYMPITIQTPTGDSTSATRTDHFILPMIHLRIKPTKTFYMHFSYTQTLSRPDFSSISPNTFVNTGWVPFVYTACNPELKSELWSNYDAQFTFHGNKIGLLSITGFYKTVKDKIWQRSYTRIKGDPIIPPFPDNANVNVTVWENHPYTVYVEGLEFDWQSSFFYLPKPFCFFTLSANYTYAHSRTTYPFTKRVNIVPPGGGRPVAIRVDSTTTGPMLYQPKNVANISLGFNFKGFNAWLSFQYNGLIFTEKNYRGVPRLDTQKDYFYRWDLQLTQKFSIRHIKGFEVIANIANISDFTESQRLRGDMRPTYRENFGMTADLGLRYRF
jgi:TonB-dependent receptor